MANKLNDVQKFQSLLVLVKKISGQQKDMSHSNYFSR